MFNSVKCEFSESNVSASYFWTLNINMSKGLIAVTLESNWRSEPAAAFLALANRGSSIISLSAFIFSNSFVPMKTSPRTVMFMSSLSFFGICAIVFKLSVTSSPIRPFPLVAPWTKIPFSYFKAVDKPSIFVSTTYFSSSLFSSATFLTLLSNSLSSSKEKISWRLWRGTSWVTCLNPSLTCPPTFWVSESFVISSGNSFSKAFNLFIIISYS